MEQIFIIKNIMPSVWIDHWPSWLFWVTIIITNKSISKPQWIIHNLYTTKYGNIGKMCAVVINKEKVKMY